MKLKFFAVTALPSTLESDAFYYVENGTFAESYITSKTGVAKTVGNSAMINSLIATAMAGWTGETSQVQIAANIPALAALESTAEVNLMVLVVDASADATVSSGSALYAYDFATSTRYKLAEYESMDVVMRWADLQDKPTSTVAQIDDTVNKAHAHNNKAVLDELGDVADELTYKGVSIGANWTTKNW